MNRLLTSLLGLALLISIHACKGPQGDVGPAGPQGATGATGATGPQGVSGVSGVSGIVTSAWSTTITTRNWFQNATDKTYFSISFSPATLTTDIINRGQIMVYARDPDDPTYVFPMPSINEIGVEGFFGYTEGTRNSLAIYIDYVSKTTPPSYNSQYRWVFIPPQPGGRLASIDWKNYAEVKKALNLTD